MSHPTTLLKKHKELTPSKLLQMKIEKLQMQRISENKPNLEPTKLVIEALQKLNKPLTREETIAQIIKTYPELWKCFLSVYSKKTALSSIGSFLFQLQNMNSYYFADQNKKYHLHQNLQINKILNHKKNNNNNNNNNNNKGNNNGNNSKTNNEGLEKIDNITNTILLIAEELKKEKSLIKNPKLIRGSVIGHNSTDKQNQENGILTDRNLIPNQNQNLNTKNQNISQIKTQQNASNKNGNEIKSHRYGELALKALGNPSSKNDIIGKAIEMFPDLWKNYIQNYSLNVAKNKFGNFLINRSESHSKIFHYNKKTNKYSLNNNTQPDEKQENETTKAFETIIKQELIKQNVLSQTNLENNNQNHEINNISGLDIKNNYNNSLNKSKMQSNVSHTLDRITRTPPNGNTCTNTNTRTNTKDLKNNRKPRNLRNNTSYRKTRNTRNSKKLEEGSQLLNNVTVKTNLKKTNKKDNAKLSTNAKKRKFLNQLIDERMGSREKGWIYGKSIIKSLNRPCSRAEIIDQGKDLFSILWSCYHDTYSTLSEAESFFGRILIPSNIKSHGVNLKDGLYFADEKQQNNNNNNKIKKNKKKTKEKAYVIKTKQPASEKKRRISKRLKNKKKVVKSSEKDPQLPQIQNNFQTLTRMQLQKNQLAIQSQIQQQQIQQPQSKLNQQFFQMNPNPKEPILNNNNNSNKNNNTNIHQKREDKKIIKDNFNNAKLNQLILENININQNQNEILNHYKQNIFNKKLPNNNLNNHPNINNTNKYKPNTNNVHNTNTNNYQNNTQKNNFNINETNDKKKENNTNHIQRQSEDINQNNNQKINFDSCPKEERKRTSRKFNFHSSEETSQKKLISKSKKSYSHKKKRRRRNRKKKRSSYRHNYNSPNSPYTVIYSDENVLVLEEEVEEFDQERYKNWILNAYQTLFRLNLEPKTYKNIFNEISRGNHTIIHQLNNINRDVEKEKILILQLLLQINPTNK
ncbi:hypothetical protein M0812_08456 [Anaeramoeba flamelloides]|uniref:Uncharacterized protein n=1 Tax=Anaeramoeba flamelloides TaxID=1746091 RepID=A0AAV7ZZP3_9EUKA|nr:hypothetical protein M0812_08456 [Anaeramoeba flamelloides]